MSKYYVYCLAATMMLGGVTAGWIGAKADIPLIQVQTDPETDCQYMVNRNGGITPRIDADAVHMGCRGLQGGRE